MKKELGCPFTMKEYEEVVSMETKKCGGNCGCNGKCGDNCKCKQVSFTNATEEFTIKFEDLTKDQKNTIEVYAKSFGYSVDQITLETTFNQQAVSIPNPTFDILPVALPNVMMRVPHGYLIETPIRIEDLK